MNHTVITVVITPYDSVVIEFSLLLLQYERSRITALLQFNVTIAEMCYYNTTVDLLHQHCKMNPVLNNYNCSIITTVILQSYCLFRHSFPPVAMVTQCLDKVTSQQEALTCVYGESLVLGLDLDTRDLGVRTPPPVLLWTSEVLDVVWSRDSWRPLYSVSLKKQNK